MRNSRSITAPDFLGQSDADLTQQAETTAAQDKMEREAYVTGKDWEKYAMSSDPMDPETYLYPDTLVDSREFFRRFIDALLIRPESVEIQYSIDSNDFGPPAGPYTHKINLDQSRNTFQTRRGVETGTYQHHRGPPSRQDSQHRHRPLPPGAAGSISHTRPRAARASSPAGLGHPFPDLPTRPASTRAPSNTAAVLIAGSPNHGIQLHQ